MKKILLLFCLCFTATYSFAQYQTAGNGSRLSLSDLVANSNGAVTFSGNTYFVNDSITIAQTDTLAITTNEVIKLDDKIMFTIAGKLLVSPPDSVVITAMDPAKRFHSLRFEEHSSGSVLRKAIVEYGSGIRILYADILIDSCVIRYHGRAYNSGAINASGSRFTVSNSKIHDNARSAILTPSNVATSPIIINNHIYSNATENGNYPQVNLGVGDVQEIIIKGNLVEGGLYNNSGGVSVSNLLGGVNYTRCAIDSNTVRNNRYGIAITGARIIGYIRGNLLENNNINPNAMTGGSGLNFNSPNPTQQIIASRNIITGNQWGVTVQSGAQVQSGPTVSLGRVNPTDSSDVGLNEIYNNGNGGNVYDIYNNTTDTVWAQNNYWGTDSVSLIEDHIYHQPDNPLHGFVNYLPLRQPVITSLKEAVAQQPLVRVFPNPVYHSATFQVALPAAAAHEPAALVIFDQLGREVAKLLNNEPLTQESLRWEPQQLPNGLYFYRLTTRSQSFSGKLLLKR